MQIPLLLDLFLIAASADVLSINQGVIVHLFEWRWADIAKECEDFLAPNGFAGVQVSPPNENIIVNSPPRPWWERYQPISYKLTTRSGTEEELQDMLNRCNKVGVRIFGDAVLNHMTGPAKVAVGTGGSTADPLAYSYPAVPFSKEDFHLPACAVNNYNDANNVRNCELLGLRDLDNSKPNVRRKQLEYLNKLVDMGFAGFRIDSAKHMWPADLKYMINRLVDLNTEHGFPPNLRPLIYMEVIDNGGEAIHWQDYSSLGLVTDFRFGNALGETFLGGKPNLAWLKNFGKNGNLLPNNVGVVFVDNHDTQRDGKATQLNYKTFRPYKMATAFMLAYPWGTPKILSSYYFDTYDQGPPHDAQYHTLSPSPITKNLCSNKWVCEHRWRQTYNMVRFHNVVSGTDVNNWWDNGKDQISFCRGNKGFVAFNRESTNLSRRLQTCLPRGKYCDVISGSLESNKCTGKMVEVVEDGTAMVEIAPFKLYDPNVENDGVLALHVQAKIMDESDAEAGASESNNPSGGNKNQPSEGDKTHPSGSTPGECQCSDGTSKNPFGGKLSPGTPGSGTSCGGGSFSGGSGSSGSSSSSACNKLMAFLMGSSSDGLGSDGSCAFSSILGQGNDDLALLRAIVKIRKLEKIIDVLSLI